MASKRSQPKNLDLLKKEDAEMVLDLLHHLKNSCSIHEKTDLTPAGKVSVQFDQEVWSRFISTIVEIKEPVDIKIVGVVEGGILHTVMSNVPGIEVSVRDVDDLREDEHDRDPVGQFAEGGPGGAMNAKRWAEAGYPYEVY